MLPSCMEQADLCTILRMKRSQNLPGSSVKPLHSSDPAATLQRVIIPTAVHLNNAAGGGGHLADRSSQAKRPSTASLYKW